MAFYAKHAVGDPFKLPPSDLRVSKVIERDFPTLVEECVSVIKEEGYLPLPYCCLNAEQKQQQKQQQNNNKNKNT
jgi:hypothetical protein